MYVWSLYKSILFAMHPVGFIGNGENINFELFQATVFFVVVVVVGFWSC